MKIPTNPFKTYTSPKGRDFMVTGIEKLPITGNWRIHVKFLDTGEFKALVYDYYEKLIRVEEI